MRQTPHQHRAELINSFIVLSIAISVLFGILFVRDQKESEAKGETTANFFVVK